VSGTAPGNDALDAAILEVAASRGARSSVSPSEVAIALAGEGGVWQPLLPKLRARAIVLMGEGRLEILRKGKPVDSADEVRGVIRFRAKA
jgi:hypothetical protein